MITVLVWSDSNSNKVQLQEIVMIMKSGPSQKQEILLKNVARAQQKSTQKLKKITGCSEVRVLW